MATFDIASPILKRPHLVVSALLLCAVLGFIGFRSMPMNLFPDANYPQVIVLISEPGASAGDVEDKVTRPVEKALYAISLVRTVRSSSQDGMAAVSAEFEYEKGLDSAATDVSNALKKIEAALPATVLSPQIFKVSDATSPVFTLALFPKPGSFLDLSRIRQLADNEIRETFLRIPEVGDVEIFGGYKGEICIDVDPAKLNDFGLDLNAVILAIRAQNLNMPDGLILRTKDQLRIKTYGEKRDMTQLASIVLGTRYDKPVLLRDVANIRSGIQDRQSLFMGNGHEAIGLNILRPEKTGHVTTTIAAVEQQLPAIRAQFPDVEFQIADTQKRIIETSIINMTEALRDSIIMTVLVIFLTLASIRLASLAAVSIPLACFMAFAGMYLLGYELNIVTMTAIILSVGLLVDDSIVVIENIQRHMAMGGRTVHQAVIDGLNEIVLADWAGTLTTVIVLVPIMFVSGYSQKILGPLTVVLSLTLLSSFVVSITVIPLLAKRLLKGPGEKNLVERIVALVDRFVVVPLRNFFVDLVTFALGKRFIFLTLGMVLLVLSVRQIPLVGRDLMPSMDTGIIKVSFSCEADASITEMEHIAGAVEKIIKGIPGLEIVSLNGGSEPGVVSFGTGRTVRDAIITAHFIDRFHRKKTIWQIEDQIREESLKIPGITSLAVYDFGATPLSSIAAPVDVMISGPDPKTLDQIGKKVEARLMEVKGLTSVSRSWTWDKKEALLLVDPQISASYGIGADEVSKQLNQAIQGYGASVLRVPGQDGHVIRVRYERLLRNNLQDVSAIQIKTQKGVVPLSELARLETHLIRTLYTRKDLMPVIDIYGYRATAAISHLHDRIADALSGIILPDGYHLSFEGEYKNMGETGRNLGRALGIAVILLFFSLVVTFRSVLNSVVIMGAIPLAIIGAVWGLLVTGRHMCMPATMGMILLAGIVVNNSILLIDFIQQAREEDSDVKSAIIEAVRMRTRPIFMTVACTVVGMWPVAAQKALGLERLSPLAVVAIGGLLVSTLLTLVYVPIFYSLTEQAREWFKCLRSKQE